MYNLWLHNKPLYYRAELFEARLALIRPGKLLRKPQGPEELYPIVQDTTHLGNSEISLVCTTEAAKKKSF